MQDLASVRRRKPSTSGKAATQSWWWQSHASSSTEQDDKRKGLLTGNLEEEEGEEWVTVSGFPRGAKNMVLDEFEKCGKILEEIRDGENTNGRHILYEKRSDALKALSKDGMMIKGVGRVVVVPVDMIQKQAIYEKLANVRPSQPSSARVMPNLLESVLDYFFKGLF